MARPLFEHLDELRARVGPAPLILLFLDFDGTLAPIVKSPGLAALPAETRDVLAGLVARDEFEIVVISGRALDDVRRRVDMEGVTCAGNHGLEISGRGLSYVEPVSRARQPALAALAQELETKLHAIRGVEIEDKGLSASIHFRQAPEAQSEVRRIVENALAANDLFCLREGKMILEILPCVPWRKDAAVTWIRRMPGFDHGLPIGIGDDGTDEDVFSATADGISVRVGETANTTARYFVRDTDDVRSFLVWLGEVAHGK